jgi:hypothetical protein
MDYMNLFMKMVKIKLDIILLMIKLLESILHILIVNLYILLKKIEKFNILMFLLY